MYKVGVIGDDDSIYGFATLGLDIFPVKVPEEGARILRNLARNEYAIIYVTEELAQSLDHEIEKYRESMLPAIILIPGIKGNTNQGVAGISQSVEKAVGSDILFANHERESFGMEETRKI